VRSSINTHEDFATALTSMKDFFKRITADPPDGKGPVQVPEEASDSAKQTDSKCRNGKGALLR